MTHGITIRRADHNAQNRYFLLLRATAQDTRLSFEARGVLTYLLSKPDDWQLQIDDLMREGDIGRNRVYRLLKELTGAGYLQRGFERDDKMRVRGVLYLVYEEPFTGNQKTDDLFTGNQDTEKLFTENLNPGFGDSIQNTDSERIQKKEQKTENHKPLKTPGVGLIPAHSPVMQNSLQEEQPTGWAAALAIAEAKANSGGLYAGDVQAYARGVLLNQAARRQFGQAHESKAIAQRAGLSPDFELTVVE